MAFTGAQKASIRNYLGFSELYHDIDTRLESQMDSIPVRSPDAATLVIARLSDLDDIRTRLGIALDNLELVQAEDVTFLGPTQLEALRDQGRMLVQQIAIVFDVVPQRDVFAIAGEGGWGGVIPLG